MTAEAPEGYRACHCLCGKAHPSAKGICNTFNVVGTRRMLASFGVVEVPVCGPCVLAADAEPAPPAPEGGWTPDNIGPEMRRLAQAAQPLIVRLPPEEGTAP